MSNVVKWPVRRVLVALARLAVVLVCSLGLLPSVSAQTIPAPRYPLKLTTDKTYLVDQDNRPFFINGDSAWSLVVNTTQAEAAQYLQDRAAKGYNAIIVNLIDRAFGENVPNNLAGDPPFTTPNDFTTPGTAYWNRVDWVLNEAAANGIVVFAHPLYLGYQCGAEGWCQAAKNSSVAAMRAYGEFLGQRYANQPNIVWVIGGDANPVAEGVESQVMAMVNGIKIYDSVHLMTAHNDGQSAIGPAWADDSWIDLNTIYTYSYTHQVTLDEYNRADTRPIYLQETGYEREHSATDLEVRRQGWWAVLSGAQLGHFFGNCPIWGFDNVLGYCSAPSGGWQGQLNSTSSNQLSYVGKLFASRAFYLLIPDQTSSVMTNGVQSGATKATTARATDGSSVIAYIPTSRLVRIDMTKVAGSQGHAWWFNPRDAGTVDLGTFDNTGSRDFTPPDANDWVLVIDNASLSLPAPGTRGTPVPHDFNNDGRSDILWRESASGLNAIWQMDGTTLASSALIPSVTAPGWTIAGQGDFDGDGKTDILWRNITTGDNAIWFMNGTSFTGGALIPSAPSTWEIAGVGDFNGDGKADILWRESASGFNAIWQMDGVTLASSALIPSVSAVGWAIAGVGDFFGDGKADILWRNTTTGDNAIWFMNGFTLASSSLIPAVPNTWAIAGVGDYNGDGKADILWHDSTGQNAIWLMNGTALATSALILSVPTTWAIVGTGDYDGDGKADILWRESTGQNAIWLMNGTNFTSGALIPGVPTSWSVSMGQ